MNQRQIRRLVRKYQALLGLERWTIKIVFSNTTRDRANVIAQEEYHEATVTFNLKRMREMDDDPDKMVRHEILHIPTWPMVHVSDHLAGTDKAKLEMARLAQERVVAWLESAPLWEQVT
jgi:hypothetical protein